MGIFPIIMNIVQFWLIDSIVKAGGQTSSEPLGSATRTSYDREPLFRANSDDEDDDDDIRPNDIENPPTHSPSTPRDTLVPPTPAESKLSIQTQTLAGSSSSSPKSVDQIGKQMIALHAYPPPVGSTSTSPVSTTSLHSPDSSLSPNSAKSRRRSPPPPLTLSSRAGFPAVVVTPQISTATPQHRSAVDTLAQDEKADWAAWGSDDGDDWADKVGEEEWTGRRMGSKVETLHDVWSTHEEFRPVTVAVA